MEVERTTNHSGYNKQMKTATTTTMSNSLYKYRIKNLNTEREDFRKISKTLGKYPIQRARVENPSSVMVKCFESVQKL